MGGMFSKPKMPKIEPPKMPATPRMPVETDPDIEKRSKMAKLSKRRNRNANLLSENTRTKNSGGGQSLGGGGYSSNVG